MMTPLQSFVSDYRRIRAAEGHGFSTVTELQRLPEVDRGHRHAAIWRIRQRSFDALITRVLPLLGVELRILDLGAGCGWLSHRLGQLGHKTVAVDINCDEQDGLGAAGRLGCYRVLAEFDRLPFPNDYADVAIFNGSFHYSTDFTVTLREAFRVCPLVVVMDSPIYHDETSGRCMVEEQYDQRSKAIACRQFLTWSELRMLADWHIVRPSYGLKWRLKPLIAAIRQTREPAQFAILVARRAKA
jgi:SAM-dependent methyltransferase